MKEFVSTWVVRATINALQDKIVVQDTHRDEKHFFVSSVVHNDIDNPLAHAHDAAVDVPSTVYGTFSVVFFLRYFFRQASTTAFLLFQYQCE